MGRRSLWVIISALAAVGGLLLALRLVGGNELTELRNRAMAAAQAGEWMRSLELLRKINSTSGATSSTLLAEGQACLKLGRAAQAERALRKAVAAAPAEPTAWLLVLEILRVEDRLIDSFDLGWKALDQLALAGHSQILRELSLAALTDLPDDLARNTLRRWTEADPGDVDAQVALLRRMGAEPRADDPDRDARLGQLRQLVANHPDHIAAREVLATALADAAEMDESRQLLETWPADRRDGRFWRLLGRWELDLGHHAEQAIAALKAALADFPHDWRIHYRLARALQIAGRSDEARQEAETVSRIRELLDPLTLGPKLDAAFSHLDEPAALQTLANLCERVGLSRLANRWHAAVAPQG